MLAEILSTISTVVTGAAGWLVAAFKAIVGVFWDSTANNGAGAMTEIGILAIVGFGVALVLIVLNRVFGLFRGFGRR